MKYCNSCGNQIQDNIEFCPSCGEKSSIPSQATDTIGKTGTTAQTQSQQYQQQYQQQPQPQQAHQTYAASGVSAQMGMQDAQSNKGIAILAYIIFFIPLLIGAHKTSSYVKYHTNQGTVLFLFILTWSIVYGVLAALSAAILFTPSTMISGSWGLYSIITLILGLIWLLPAIFCILGIIHAAQGKMKPLPMIGRFTIIK